MGCLKCGKETEEKQVFCSDCRQVMEQYPVKPGTLVRLPHRVSVPQEKNNRRKQETPAEAMTQMRSLIRWLCATVAVLTVLICLLSGILLQSMGGKQETNMIGRNYTTADPAQQTLDVSRETSVD